MNRRQFINKIAALLALSGLAGLQLSCLTKSKGRIGIQLYSVKDELPKDFLGTLKKLADMGYSSIEAYGFTKDDFFGHTMKELSNIAKDMGMSVSGSHIWTGANIRDTNPKEWDFWKKCADIMTSGGAAWAVLSSFPKVETLDDLKLAADYFNQAGKICLEGGVKFGFHNHTEEFKEIEEEIILDFVIKNTDPKSVFFQLDTGHAVNAGVDCRRYLKDFPGRFPMWHASDFDAVDRKYTVVGKGSVPYPELFDMAESSGLEQLTVEQETSGDIFASCKADFEYLKQFKWTKV
jgi:sugar phosphate isomerase/epimerase